MHFDLNTDKIYVSLILDNVFMMEKKAYCISAMYQFVEIDNIEEHKEFLLDLGIQLSVKGTIILGTEGFNGTIAATKESIIAYRQQLIKRLSLSNFNDKLSYSDYNPFYRYKVKTKKEIVTIGDNRVKPSQCVGKYVKPHDWNQLISDPEVLVIDTRNHYEIAIGRFKHAINPQTENFREFPDYVKQQLIQHKKKKIAMYCTGGIRCEKSTSFLLSEGFEEVYHLEGGILKYLEEIPSDDSLWQGECFVFDNRVSVNHQLQPGTYRQCYACRMPIDKAAMDHPHYQLGISCPKCYNQTSDNDKERFRQRQLQCERAKKISTNEVCHA